MGLFDLYTGDEVFVTGTAAEVAPITKVDGRVIGNGKPGPITAKLIAAFRELTQTTGTLSIRSTDKEELEQRKRPTKRIVKP